jgi:hypothetical protein
MGNGKGDLRLGAIGKGDPGLATRSTNFNFQPSVNTSSTDAKTERQGVDVTGACLRKHKTC